MSVTGSRRGDPDVLRLTITDPRGIGIRVNVYPLSEPSEHIEREDTATLCHRIGISVFRRRTQTNLNNAIGIAGRFSRACAG
jgi:hypothetical protein